MSAPHRIEQFSARDFARVIFKRTTLITLVIVLPTLIVGLYSFLVLPTYEAHAKILLAAQKEMPIPTARKLDTFRSSVEISATESEVIKSVEVLGEMVKALDLANRPKPSGLKGWIHNNIQAAVEWIRNTQNRIREWVIRLVTGKTPEQGQTSAFDLVLKDFQSTNILKVKPVERTDVIDIEIRDHDPLMAARIANAVALSYILYKMEMLLEDYKVVFRSEHPRILKMEQDIHSLSEQIGKEELRGINWLNQDTLSGEIKFIQRAGIPLKPVKPKKILNLLVAVAASVFAALALAFLLESLDQSFKTPMDVWSMIGSNPLTSLPYILLPKQGGKEKPFWEACDINGTNPKFRTSIRVLISEILKFKKEKGLRSLAMVSAEEGVGKSTLSYFLASELASHTKEKILLIDADLRGPEDKKSCLKRWVKLPYSPGLSDLINGSLPLNDLVQTEPQKKFAFIPAGEGEVYPEALFASEEIKKLLLNAKTEFDLVIVDTPALKDHPDGASLSSWVDGVIFVIHSNSTRKQVVNNYLLDFEHRQIPVIGTVMNFRKFEIPEFVYQNL